MIRIIYFLLIGLFLGCQVSMNKKGDTPASLNPNIIIFLTDDLGYGDLSCYGNPIIKTPHIDKFATEGVRLTDCHSAGTVCSPSRAAILTGRNPYRSGFFYIAGRDTHLKTEEITIAELLREEGYETSFWGKWHLSALEKDKRDEPGPGDQGFDYYFASTHNAFEGPKNYRKFIRNGEAVGEVEGWYCDVIVDEASKWLKNIRNKEKPFFMSINPHEPHTPIAPPETFSENYNTEEVKKLEKSIKYGQVSRPDKDISENSKAYYGTVSQLDEAFGRLMITLETLGLKENTLVIFTSDNGPETPVTLEESLGNWDDPIRDFCFGTPGEFRGMKRFPYEGGHRVPGIARFPGIIPEGTVSDVLFNGTDFLPTIAGLTGTKVPFDRNIDGIDAFDALLNKEVKRDVSPIWFYPNHEDTYFRMPQISMRRNNFTLISYLPAKDDTMDLRTWMEINDPVKFELYNIASDPSQKHNILSLNSELGNDMKSEMITLWKEMRDEGLTVKINSQ